MLAEHLQPYDNVIWDWNGTLLHDVDLVWEANQRILAKRNVRSPSLAEYREVFCFPVIEYYRKIGMDLDDASFAELASDYAREYEELVLQAELFEGTVDLLHGLQKGGKRLAVLSAAEQGHLDQVLEHFAIRSFFECAYGVADKLGRSKVARGRELLRDTGFIPSRTVLVGDTDHDLEVGRELGVDVLLVADGHQSYERLARVHPGVLRSRFALAAL